jgi:hypothetical protein
MVRVLLVEVAAVNGFQRAVAFPFVRGWLRDQDVAVRWLRFGVPAAARAGSAEPGIGLDGADRARLLDAARDGVTHLLFSHTPAPSLVRAVAALRPAPRQGLLREHDGVGAVAAPVGVALATVAAAPAALAGFFGTGGRPAAGNLFEDVAPDFGWEPANPAAAAAPPLPYLVVGELCSHRAPVAASPFFRGVDLGPCSSTRGCTFCLYPPRLGRWRARPIALLRTQLEALRRTHRAGAERLAVRVLGEPLLADPEAIADLLRAEPSPPLDLLLECRATVILRIRRRLERALARLRGTRHRLHVCLLGLESFADDELLRMNKGATWRDNLDAVRALLEVERDHPETFAFRRHGGVSLILFTPWTRLEELALNLGVIGRCGLDAFCGRLLSARLRLYPVLPLHALAARDGLLAPRYRDPLLDTARRTLYPDETPWRSRDPRVDRVASLLVRLDAAGAARPDPLGRRVRSLLEETPGPARPLAAAEALVDAALASDARATPARLIAGARRQLRAGRGLTRAPAATVPRLFGRDPRGLAEGARMWLLAFAIGQKPVVRLEPSDLEVLGRVDLARLAPVVRQRRSAGARRAEVFLGRDEQAVAEAIRLTEVVEGARDPADAAGAVRALGGLYGYPACCAAAFAARADEVARRTSWLQVAQRVAVPGPVPCELNPGCAALVRYVPCSLACAETRRLAGDLLAAFRARHGAGRAARFARFMRHPWLMLVDHQDAAVELCTDEAPGASFRFRAGAVRGRHPLLERVAAGDEIRLTDHELLVLRRGRLQAALGGRAYVWWHEAPVQPELWSRMLALRALMAPPPAPPAATSVARLLTAALTPDQRPGPTVGGWSVAAIAAAPEAGGAHVTLARGDERARLLVTPRAASAGAATTAGPLAVVDPDRGDGGREALVRAFTRELRTALRRLSAAGRA